MNLFRRVQQWTVVNTVMNLQVPQQENFLKKAEQLSTAQGRPSIMELASYNIHTTIMHLQQNYQFILQNYSINK